MLETTRFAPSPTGYLHLGHAYSALFARRAAGRDGRFLLRIEDIDPTRCRAEYATAIREDLAWLGLRWEEPVRVQSSHFADYRAALDKLLAAGLLYPCFCTRADIQAEIARSGEAPHGPDGLLYPGTCRHLDASARAARIASGTPYALRLDMAQASSRAGDLGWRDAARGEVGATPRVFGDVVLARKETPASYHLAVTMDDALQGVSLVTRGEDLFAATHIHRLLQALLGLPTPRYHHHALLVSADGKRLAKRDRAATLRDLRAAGTTAAQVRAMAGFAD
ncbi:MAG: tRNA glutamyl-Q(34) synthetase GluQRS [Alphaproteobacteria bacterium]|nr:tRNA glutamyl-Q(34) synthetase GluQRS [Alphaproteobacteria bacterium]